MSNVKERSPTDDPPSGGEQGDVSGEIESQPRNKRKQLRSKITRAVNRLRQLITSSDRNTRRIQQFLKEIKEDYANACEIHGQLYDFVDSSQISRLDQWETDLAHDVYKIQEEVEDYLATFDIETPEQKIHTRSIAARGAVQNVSLTLPNEHEGSTVTGNPEDAALVSDAMSAEMPRSHQGYPRSYHGPYVVEPTPFKESFDSWIDSLIEFQETVITSPVRDMSISEALFKLEASKDIPTIRLDKFNGNPLSYVDFVERFKIHIHDKAHLSDDMRMVQLKMHLTGEAERAISGLGASGSMYATALKCMKDQFGQASSITRACLKTLTEGAKIGVKDRQGLRDMSLNVINCISVFHRIGYQADINASENLRQIVRRLPDPLIGRWKRLAADLREKGQVPTINQVSEMIRKQVRAEFDPDYGDIQVENKPSQNYHKDKRKSINSNQVRFKGLKCFICEENHRVSECRTFLDSTVNERLEQAKTNRLCFSCLVRGHTLADCRSKKKCTTGGCNRSHHVLLHTDPPTASGVASVLDQHGIMPVVRVLFHAANGKVREGNVLIDSGAGTTVIRREFAKALGLQGKKERFDIAVVGGETVSQPQSRRVKFSISSLTGSEEYPIEAHEIEKTILSVPPLNRPWLQSYQHLADLKFSHKAGPVDLILGVQYSHLHVDEETRQGLPFEPVGKRTPLGWYVLGSETNRTSSVCTIGLIQPIDLEKFYAMETLGVQGADCNCTAKPLSLDDRRALSLFQESCHKSGNRYTIGLPWKEDPAVLPDNYVLAEKRLLSLEKSLLRDPKKGQLYDDVIGEYLKNGWAIQLTEKEINNKPAYYLPHHGVYRPEKQSTPLRVVFDPACVYKGISLNSLLYKGPCLIGNLLGILIRFREDEVAFMGDISKMYLQICLPESDTYLHRFLWRNLDSTRDPTMYRLLRVTFGDKSSPDMASFVMLRIADEANTSFPQAATILQRDRYVDDLIHSCTTREEAVSKMNQLDQLLGTGSFHIKKWFCSSQKLEPEKGDNQSSNRPVEEVPLSKDDPTKALGLVWKVSTDVIRYDVKYMEPTILTKRIVLSRISGIYDPLGLVSVITIKARIALQDVWRLKRYDWDDELPQELQVKWANLFREIQELSRAEFPRSLKPSDAYGSPELHVFSDASAYAYGAVAYIVWQTSRGPEVRLASAKARVAPLRQTTIPRLELMGALIACRLARTLVDEFKVKPTKVVLWSDSQIVLHWIQSESITLKVFVGVRISEIQSTWAPDKWRFVATEDNPADCLTRGLSVDEINGRWKHGPDFLRQTEENWPLKVISTPKEDDEQKKTQMVCVITPLDPIFNPGEYSSWQRLIRVTAYVQRFCHNAGIRGKTRSSSQKRLINALQPEEIDRAQRYWITIAQRDLGNWKKKCDELSPFHEDEVVRVGGRLGRSELPYDQIHPVLLPASHEVSKLIMRNVHVKMGHVGSERTLSESRRRFWIVRGRNLAKSIVRDCVVCRKLRQQPHETLMADLPPERMTPYSPPFTVTGVDLFGPFNLKYGRNKSQKAWGAIFTCATVRAIHLEIVDGLSTQAFLHTLRRFVTHHGWPSTIISDNGTSFVGAHKELRKLVQEGKRQIEDFASLHRVKWRFITPLSPHQGGLYESLIKQVKQAIQVAIGQQVLSWNEMATVFAEVECLINSRPLGYAANNPNDPQPLTPNHFMMGRAGASVPQGPFQETVDLRKRFEYVQTLVLQVWKRFIREYVPTLIKRTKWKTKGRQLQVGDIVLLTDFNLPRGKWVIGRIIEVYPGSDGVVRNVKVRTQTGEYKRSIQRCCLILQYSE